MSITGDGRIVDEFLAARTDPDPALETGNSELVWPIFLELPPRIRPAYPELLQPDCTPTDTKPRSNKNDVLATIGGFDRLWNARVNHVPQKQKHRITTPFRGCRAREFDALPTRLIGEFMLRRLRNVGFEYQALYPADSKLLCGEARANRSVGQFANRA
jgi:hypothetical protein